MQKRLLVYQRTNRSPRVHSPGIWEQGLVLTGHLPRAGRGGAEVDKHPVTFISLSTVRENTIVPGREHSAEMKEEEKDKVS